jgi:phage terminase small subunit
MDSKRCKARSVSEPAAAFAAIIRSATTPIAALSEDKGYFGALCLKGAIRLSRHETFARYVAQGKTKREAAILAGFSKKTASSQGTHLSKRVKIAQRIAYLQEQVADKAVESAAKLFELEITSKQDRVRRYAEIQERLWQIVEERSADPAMAKVPGGKSGFIVRQIKIIGTGANQRIVPEYVVDTGLAREIRAINQQAAEELGQWKNELEDEKRPNKLVYRWIDPPKEEEVEPGPP